ncbi:FAD-binding domain-containing protein [Pleurotus eryngii]|uniref:FAD-binding domain-containing protein n=1 Tax=Pleurotus eryngii TaxID=5323 RepID=A0A9P6DBD7_PLEER|nr:FAD-binding domain-containing protein [Pleurotus eryngii]
MMDESEPLRIEPLPIQQAGTSSPLHPVVSSQILQYKDKAIEAFKSQGTPVLEPGLSAYDHAIATSNLLYRFLRPGCVVQPESAEHVRTIVKEAKSRELKITIKCNGHSYAGHCTAFKGISLDLRRMRKWGHVYGTLINGGHDGFIVKGGCCPTVGVSGFTLGGGLGRSFGMSGTLMEPGIVTADGNLVTVKEVDDPKSDEGKLFCALRGAGGGNFGIVVKLKSKFPKAGFTDDVIATMNDFYTTDYPNKITIDTTWICNLRQSGTLGGVRFTVAFDGSKYEYDRSTRFLYETLVNQWLEERERAYPANKTYELYSSFMFTRDNTDTIQKVTVVIRDLMASFRADFASEQVNFLVTWIHSGGKATKKKPTDSAFFLARRRVPHRDMRRFLAKVKKALWPLSLNGEAAFINFPDRDFLVRAHERAYFGDNREELRRVKQIWDEDNISQWVQGIRLPGGMENGEGESGARTERTKRMQTRLINSRVNSGNTTRLETL